MSASGGFDLSQARAGFAGADLYGDLYYATTTERPRWRELVSGLLVAGVAALAAAFLAEHYHAPIMLMGLLIGLACNFASVGVHLHPGLAFASKSLLRWGIVLMGLQITIGDVASLGWVGFGSIAGLVVVVTLIGVAAARLIGTDAAFGTLAGGSVAICGASAALTISSALGERRVSQAQLTLVLVAVSAASALAMSLYPAIAHMLHLSDRAAGFLMGASIHDVAQSLGAGYSYSDAAGKMASIVKLTRVSMLAPATLLISLCFRSSAGTRARAEMPWFVVGFLLLAVIHSTISLPQPLIGGASRAATACLLVAVTATGIRSPMGQLLVQGWRISIPVIAATIVSFGAALALALVLW